MNNDFENIKEEIKKQFDDNSKEREELNSAWAKNIDELKNKIECLEMQISINSGENKNPNEVNIPPEEFISVKNDIKKLENDIKTLKNEIYNHIFQNKQIAYFLLY